MKKCDCCGRELKKANSLYGYTLCSKHMHQLYHHGFFLDSEPRTQKDPNEYYIDNDLVYVKLYDKQSRETGKTFFFDKSDLSILLRYKKWRLSYNYPKTGYGKNQYTLGQLLLQPKQNEIVEHINGNTLDNTRKNLRLCSQSENTYNKHSSVRNKSGVIGVHFDKKRQKWCSEIRQKNKKFFIGYYEILLEADFARYIGECILFKEFRNKKNEVTRLNNFQLIPLKRQNQIKEYVTQRIRV